MKKRTENACLEGLMKGMSPLFQVDIKGSKLCLESFQQAPGMKDWVKPDCQYCSNNSVIVSNDYDIISGVYCYCVYDTKK